MAENIATDPFADAMDEEVSIKLKRGEVLLLVVLKNLAFERLRDPGHLETVANEFGLETDEDILSFCLRVVKLGARINNAASKAHADADTMAGLLERLDPSRLH